MELKDCTTEELRAELKRRNAEEKAKKASILRCRMCKHWGAIDYWGYPTSSLLHHLRSSHRVQGDERQGLERQVA